MLNRYPLWKYLMLVGVFIIGIVYSLPNLYGEDPAIQITASRGLETKVTTQEQAKKALDDEGIPIKSMSFDKNAILVRFFDNDAQLRAQKMFSTLFGDDYSVALNLAPATPSWLSILGAEPMKLGLDLRGGVHFLMEVDMTTVLDKIQDNIIESLRGAMVERQIALPSFAKLDRDKVVIRFTENAPKGSTLSYLAAFRPDLTVVASEGNTLTVTVSGDELRNIRRDAIDQNITILRNRVNQLGVAEPVVQRQGQERIIVELPGIQDTALAKEILGATATLEFREVNTSEAIDVSAVVNKRARLPIDSELKFTRDGQAVVLYKRVILTGDRITDASSRLNEYGQPQVNISLDNAGGALMFNFSRNAIGKPMATLFVEYRDNGKKDEEGRGILEKNEEVINIATIRSELGSRFQITGIGTVAEARQLSLLLRAGALIAPIKIVEERTVGPSLGQQNIDRGLAACLWGMLLTVVFMLVVYRLFGVFASIALVANLILIVAIMSLLPGTTLTMPGIAAIVLTVGMAVDANVLINERIKEELRNGRGVQQAIHEGYLGAWSSIFDANVTTLITAVILYALGVGSIKGFAITLAIGVLTSMFTSIVGTRAIANLVYGGKRVQKISI